MGILAEKALPSRLSGRARVEAEGGSLAPPPPPASPARAGQARDSAALRRDRGGVTGRGARGALRTGSERWDSLGSCSQGPRFFLPQPTPHQALPPTSSPASHGLRFLSAPLPRASKPLPAAQGAPPRPTSHPGACPPASTRRWSTALAVGAPGSVASGRVSAPPLLPPHRSPGSPPTRGCGRS